MPPDSPTEKKAPTAESPWCVGCGEDKDSEDLYEYPDGFRCYDCCAESERNAVDACLSLSLSARIEMGRKIPQ